MLKMTRRFAGAFAVAGALFIAQGAVGAQNIDIGDGLVDVFIGEVNVLNDADIGVAAQVAAQVCGLKVGPVAVLGAAVDRSGRTRTVCMSDQGPVTIRQN